MRLRRLLLLVAVIFIIAPPLCWAHDLGVNGQLWSIAEPSLVLRMMERAATVDWKAEEKREVKDAKYQVRHMPEDGVPAAAKTTVHFVDPSVALTHSISAPVKEGDSYVWRVVYPAGTKVNPLKTGILPVTRMLFFDPADAGQTKFAYAAKAAYPDLLELVATGGNMVKLAKAIGQPVYYANPGLVHKFALTGVPALIGVGMGAHRYRVSVVQFGPKAVAGVGAAGKTIEASWYGDLPTSPHASPTRVSP